MEQLTIKHLAPYLPYGLKIQGQTHGEIQELSALSEYGVNIKGRDMTYGWWADVFDIKPVLRPLSDLTKEIEVNEERFVPVNNIFKIAEIDSPRLDISNLKESPFYMVNQLFEWHFDVFGLIEKGLAIDINSLKA